MPAFVQTRSLAVMLVASAALAACATPQPRYSSRPPSANIPPTPVNPGASGRYKVGEPYQVAGIWYVPREQADYDETGVASWYGDDFHMKATANGETFDMNQVTAAHTTLPLPSIVEVTNLDNGRKMNVRVNDRGPFVGGRILDLSREGARQLGFDKTGTARVRVRYVGKAPLLGPQDGVRYAAATPAPITQTPVAPVRGPAYVTPSAPPDEPAGAIVAPPVKVAATALPSLTPAAPAAAVIAAAPTGVYRIQAGAFGDQANAQRVADHLSATGQARIEVVERDGAPLYRVMLNGPADEAAAWALRDQVASLGYVDARVIRPF